MPAITRQPSSRTSRRSRTGHRITSGVETAKGRAYIVRLIPGRTRLPVGPEWIDG